MLLLPPAPPPSCRVAFCKRLANSPFCKPDPNRPTVMHSIAPPSNGRLSRPGAFWLTGIVEGKRERRLCVSGGGSSHSSRPGFTAQKHATIQNPATSHRSVKELGSPRVVPTAHRKGGNYRLTARETVFGRWKNDLGGEAGVSTQGSTQPGPSPVEAGRTVGIRSGRRSDKEEPAACFVIKAALHDLWRIPKRCSLRTLARLFFCRSRGCFRMTHVVPPCSNREALTSSSFLPTSTPHSFLALQAKDSSRRPSTRHKLLRNPPIAIMLLSPTPIFLLELLPRKPGLWVRLPGERDAARQRAGDQKNPGVDGKNAKT